LGPFAHARDGARVAGYDLFIDHLTGDLVDDGAGEFETTDTAAMAVYLQLCCELDAWVVEPDLGGRAHLVPRKNNLTTGTALKVAYLEAYQPLVDDGRIVDPVITIDRDKVGRIVMYSSARDSQRGQLELSDLLPFTPGDL
jgi:phage gp46-like protein